MTGTLQTWWGKDVTVGVGSFIEPDGWRIGSALTHGDSFSTFRVPTHGGGPITSLAVEVAVTGRTARYRHGSWYVRVRITFPGDGEPDVVTRGWLLLP